MSNKLSLKPQKYSFYLGLCFFLLISAILGHHLFSIINIHSFTALYKIMECGLLLLFLFFSFISANAVFGDRGYLEISDEGIFTVNIWGKELFFDWLDIDHFYVSGIGVKSRLCVKLNNNKDPISTLKKVVSVYDYTGYTHYNLVTILNNCKHKEHQESETNG